MNRIPWKRVAVLTGLAVLLSVGGTVVRPVPIAATQATANTTDTKPKTKCVKATLSHDTVKVGEQVKVRCKNRSVTYKSSNTAVAYIDKKGVITGKKAGTVTITVKKKGYKGCKLTLTVKKKAKKPSVVAVYEEIKPVGVKIADGCYQMQVKNMSKGKLRRVEYVYTASVVTGQQEQVDAQTGQISYIPVTETVTLTLKSGAVAPGETSKVMRCQAPASGQLSDMKLVKATIYAGNSKVTYHADTNQTTYGWGTEDKKAPVITGMVGADSYKGRQAYISIYEDMEFDFSKYIKATDERDGKVRIHVNTDTVDYNKPGMYTITVTATDKAGNQAKKKLKVRVEKVSDAEKMADTVLAKIVKPSWSDEKKVRAIYAYVSAHLGYTNTSVYHTWQKEAVYGFRYGVGDCFAYYSLTKVLLNRCQIPNLMIQRNTENPTHYWNMAYVKGGWYHVDTCRRQVKKYLCLVTDEQMAAFSDYYNTIVGFQSNTWDRKKYPVSAKKKLTENYR